MTPNHSLEGRASVSEHNSKGTPMEMAEPNPNSKIQRIVAVMSGKGGVGKSSITALTAVELVRKGNRVGVLDGDIAGPSFPRLFGVSREQLVDSGAGLIPAETPAGIRIMSINLLLEEDTAPVVWRGPLIGGAIKQFFTDVAWGELDVLLVDLPPGTGDAPLSTLQSLPVDGVIIVSSPQDVAVLVVEKAIKMVRLMDKPLLGLVENMSGVVCPNCGERFDVLGPSQGEALADRYGIPWLGTIPIDPRIALMDGQIEYYVSPAELTVRRLADTALGQ